MSDDKIVPFGKYKGQPIERLAADVQYCEWLTAQPWFRERYGTVYNVIVNQFGNEPTETPEHNRLQSLFVDGEFVKTFLRYTFNPEDIKVISVNFEVEGVDVLIEWQNACRPSMTDEYPAVLRQMRKSHAQILLIGEGGYSGVGATLDQVRAMFGSKKIVLLSDVQRKPDSER